jgi:hypothetical protein
MLDSKFRDEDMVYVKNALTIKTKLSPLLYVQACNEMYSNVNSLTVSGKIVIRTVLDSINIIMVRLNKT